ncbi:unnamed protein product [Gulo gulo]|uniref:Uncharacterized protein n=1 Tax=Gulo gulo TaxID=48420 RepID=A0A9X9LSN1_GULGU|nr:unnamed protein product [Gulo gulo]
MSISPSNPSKFLPGSGEPEPRFFLSSAHLLHLGAGCVICLGYGDSLPTALSNPFSIPLLAQNPIAPLPANYKCKSLNLALKAFSTSSLPTLPICIKLHPQLQLPNAVYLSQNVVQPDTIMPQAVAFLECSYPFLLLSKFCPSFMAPCKCLTHRTSRSHLSNHHQTYTAY